MPLTRFFKLLIPKAFLAFDNDFTFHLSIRLVPSGINLETHKMPTNIGRSMSLDEKARLHNEIYTKNSGPLTLTTKDIVNGCDKAKSLLSPEFVEAMKKSAFYLPNQTD